MPDVAGGNYAFAVIEISAYFLVMFALLSSMLLI
jgi:hypothetical protein